MTIFSFSEYKYLENKLIKLFSYEKGGFDVRRYTNQEMHITIKTNVKNEECVIIGNINPPDSNLISLLLLADTLKKEGAKKVIALLPYLAYARHDKSVPRESLATAWVGKILKQSGIDKIITFDLHSEKDKKLIPIPIQSIPTTDLFACVIADKKLASASLVAPDNGAIKRCDAVKIAAKMEANVSYFKKHRTKTGIVTSNLVGAVGPKAVIIDDMIDTGQTMILACKKLKKLGVKKITIFVTHGIFSGNKWPQLFKLGVEYIYCTDTLSLSRIPNNKYIKIIPILALLNVKI